MWQGALILPGTKTNAIRRSVTTTNLEIRKYRDITKKADPLQKTTT